MNALPLYNYFLEISGNAPKVIKETHGIVTDGLLKHFVFRPNDGFQEQLQLFEQMGHQVDPSHSAYKLYKLNLLSQQIQISRLLINLFLFL